MPELPPISNAQLDSICRLLVDAVTHRQLDLLFVDAGIEEAGGSPRWERMLLALQKRQAQDRCSNSVLAFVGRVLGPHRGQGQETQLREIREAVNVQLAFLGAQVGEDGRVRRSAKAETLSAAEKLAAELRQELRRRLVHEDVLKYCRAELLDRNFFHCVLEATKSLAEKIRERTGLPGDGADLVTTAFRVSDPLLALNTLRSETEKSDQKGYANLLIGIFGTFRNVPAHAPRLTWAIDRREALDALTIISYAHRRLDEAVVVRRA